jgi:hypothetical protein
MAETKRRARREDPIYYDQSRDRWTGTITGMASRVERRYTARFTVPRRGSCRPRGL